MNFSLDNYFGIHQQSLSLRSQRNTVIANNLANADTPGFKARDYDFKAVLAQAGGQAMGGEQVRVTHSRHLGGGDGLGGTGPLLYRVPMQPAQDGNTVEQDREQAAFAENSVRYQASLQFLNNRIQSMVNVLKGGNN
ncbi:MAG: flagellar basal body rod protein FlgB [Chromatocurvus sp.]